MIQANFPSKLSYFAKIAPRARVLDVELEQGGNEVVERLRAEVYEKLTSYNRTLHENYKVTLNPIKNNVGTCISALLHSATYAKSRQP